MYKHIYLITGAGPRNVGSRGGGDELLIAPPPNRLLFGLIEIVSFRGKDILIAVYLIDHQ